MPDERSPIKHHLVLRQTNPKQGAARFYSLMIELDLFGSVRLVRNWGQIGTKGRETVEEFETEADAGQALDAAAKVLRMQGYQDL